MEDESTNENETSTNSSTSEEETGSTTTTKERNSEDDLVILIITLTIIFLIALAVYVWINRKTFGFEGPGWKAKSFEAPKERELFNEAKAKLDPSIPENLEELKKLLMRRAMYTIPIVLSLQNSGTSVQRLYNRGMLTDDIYENVKEMKAFVDVEFAEVQMEAEDLIKGWGPHIWPEAMRFHQMIQQHNEQKLKQEELPERTTEEKRKAGAEQRRLKTLALQKEREMKRKEDEANKMAQQLIEEEEREKGRGKKKST